MTGSISALLQPLLTLTAPSNGSLLLRSYLPRLSQARIRQNLGLTDQSGFSSQVGSASRILKDLDREGEG